MQLSRLVTISLFLSAVFAVSVSAQDKGNPLDGGDKKTDVEKKDTEPVKKTDVEKKDTEPVKKTDVEKKDIEPVKKTDVEKKDTEPVKKTDVEKKDTEPVKKDMPSGVDDHISKGKELHYQNPRAALKHYQMALKADPNHLEALHRIGMIYTLLGRYGTSLRYFQKELRLLRKGKMTNSAGYANALNNIGVIYEKWRYYGKALYYYRRANKIRVKRGLTNTAEYAITLNNLGVVYARTWHYGKALRYYKQAHGVREKAGITGRDRGITLRNMAYLYYRVLGRACTAAQYQAMAAETKAQKSVLMRMKQSCARAKRKGKSKRKSKRGSKRKGRRG